MTSWLCKCPIKIYKNVQYVLTAFISPSGLDIIFLNLNISHLCDRSPPTLYPFSYHLQETTDFRLTINTYKLLPSIVVFLAPR